MKKLTFSAMAAARLRANKRQYLGLLLGIFLSIFLISTLVLSVYSIFLNGFNTIFAACQSGITLAYSDNLSVGCLQIELNTGGYIADNKLTHNFTPFPQEADPCSYNLAVFSLARRKNTVNKFSRSCDKKRRSSVI